MDVLVKVVDGASLGDDLGRESDGHRSEQSVPCLLARGLTEVSFADRALLHSLTATAASGRAWLVVASIHIIERVSSRGR
jgi:hypothetical protein